jgi:hypothetical protein
MSNSTSIPTRIPEPYFTKTDALAIYGVGFGRSIYGWNQNFIDLPMAPVPPQNSFWVDGNRRHKWASRIWQGALPPSFGPLARVPCWSPLGLCPGDLHAPNSLLFSSRRHFRVWVLLRFILSSNSVTVHRFVRPYLVIKSVWLHLLFLLVFLIALAGISLCGEVIRVTRVITNGAVV